MHKHLIASAAAFTLMTGVAMAQSTSVTTSESVAPVAASQSTTTIQTNPMSGEVSQTKEHKSINADGTEVQKNSSYNSSPGHTESSKSATVKNPDGSVATSAKHEWSNSGASVHSSTSTTTTTGE